MSDLVGNPEDRFSRFTAHMSHAAGKSCLPDFSFAQPKTSHKDCGKNLYKYFQIYAFWHCPSEQIFINLWTEPLLCSGWDKVITHRTYGSSNSNWYVKFQMFMSARAFWRLNYFCCFFLFYYTLANGFKRK